MARVSRVRRGLTPAFLYGMLHDMTNLNSSQHVVFETLNRFINTAEETVPESMINDELYLRILFTGHSLTNDPAVHTTPTSGTLSNNIKWKYDTITTKEIIETRDELWQLASQSRKKWESFSKEKQDVILAYYRLKLNEVIKNGEIPSVNITKGFYLDFYIPMLP